MGVDPLEEAEAVLERKALPGVFTGAAPLSPLLRASRECIEGGAPKIRVVEPFGDLEAATRAGLRLRDIAWGDIAQPPESPEALRDQKARDRSVVTRALEKGVPFREQPGHLFVRRPASDGPLGAHVEGEQPRQHPELLVGRTMLLAAEPKRRQVRRRAIAHFLVAQSLVQFRKV